MLLPPPGDDELDFAETLEDGTVNVASLTPLFVVQLTLLNVTARFSEPGPRVVESSSVGSMASTERVLYAGRASVEEAIEHAVDHPAVAVADAPPLNRTLREHVDVGVLVVSTLTSNVASPNRYRFVIPD
jgi:hypothetical protein